MTQPMLHIEGVHAGYGMVNALDGINLRVDRGEIVALIGSNGAGKTTTLMCCSGIHRVRQGRIVFDGKEVQKTAAHELPQMGLAQVPEGRKIFPRLSVLENLEMGAFTRTNVKEIEQDFDRIYSLFPILAERRAQPGGTLSGGEQQMLAIGRALMSRPSMLLLDEPSMGVAPLLVKRIFETIKELNAEGMTVLLVEQNAQLALKLSHRAYVLETGRIVLEGPATQLLNDQRVREAYLGG